MKYLVSAKFEGEEPEETRVSDKQMAWYVASQWLDRMYTVTISRVDK